MSTLASRQFDFVDDKNNGVPITASRMDSEFDNVITKLNQKAFISASTPSSPVEGMVWIDTGNDLVKYYRNSEWVHIGVVQMDSSAMSNIQNGDLWLDTGNSLLKIRIAGSWETLITSTSESIVPTGTVIPYAGATAPSGWLLCYGQAVSRTTYDTLFALIGTTYGAGNGSTTFNVPDMRGRVPLGKDNMGGASANIVTDANADSLGGAVGAEDVQLSQSEIPDLTIDIPADNGGTPANTRFLGRTGSTNGELTVTTNETSGSSSGDAHNNVQPSRTLNYIIKT